MREYKKTQHEKNAIGCEICGWKPPKLADAFGKGHEARSMLLLHVHHVVPRSQGGGDQFDNLILLCPNHHAIAHGINVLWRGTVANREKLANALRLADDDPQGWIDRFDFTTGLCCAEGHKQPIPSSLVGFGTKKRAWVSPVVHELGQKQSTGRPRCVEPTPSQHELDDLIIQRKATLRKLKVAYADAKADADIRAQKQAIAIMRRAGIRY